MRLSCNGLSWFILKVIYKLFAGNLSTTMPRVSRASEGLAPLVKQPSRRETIIEYHALIEVGISCLSSTDCQSNVWIVIGKPSGVCLINGV